MATASDAITLFVGGHEVSISSPDKIYFPQAGYSKRQLLDYYLAVQDGALRAIKDRPLILRRFVHGVDVEPFFQKRVPKHPDYVKSATFRYPSGGVAEEAVVDNAAALAWIVNLGCTEMHAHPVRMQDLEHPDELRIDLDPTPGVDWHTIVAVAHTAHAVLDDMGLIGWPKTTGSRGVHILVRLGPGYTFEQLKRAGLAFAREVEKRAPTIATSKWAKEDRHGVLVDYNQNARDRTTAAAYSVRPTPDARVSMPLLWDQLGACNPADFTLATVPALFAKHGDAHAAIEDVKGDLAKLLALADEHERDGTAPSKKTAKGAPKKEKHPLLVIARSKSKPDALAGLERWRARHPDVVAHLLDEDTLVDAMRGRSSAWYRVRVNLKSVPVEVRPPQETIDPDVDPNDPAINPRMDFIAPPGWKPQDDR
ncbi:MAG TPA: DNA primase small subunit domain-containing protein [Myxococcota bacterium]